MGLSASQMRYLSLTARQSDLEYQAQQINNERLRLADRTANANKAYTEGMNNKIIRIANYENDSNNKTVKVWKELTFANAMEQGCYVIGDGGTSLIPSPYVEYTAGQEISAADYNALPDEFKSKFEPSAYDLTEDITMFAQGSKISDEDFNKLYQGHKNLFTRVEENGEIYHIATSDIVLYAKANGENFATSPITLEQYRLLSSENQAKCTPRINTKGATFTAQSFICYLNENYSGMDIQSLLVSGQGQIVSSQFYRFLCDHGYGTGKYYSLDNNGNQTGETTYEKLVEEFQNNNDMLNTRTVVDWRSDTQSMFNQELYTEDDAQVLANWEAATAQVQQDDKLLELQLKRIETERNAIQTEMEAVKKVIEKNIENSYKTFG